jgi:hypothetical protein
MEHHMQILTVVMCRSGVKAKLTRGTSEEVKAKASDRPVLALPNYTEQQP